MDKTRPIVLAITAASGIIFGIRILEFLIQNEYKVELVISENAYYIAKHELGLDLSHNAEIIKKNILDFIKLEDKSGSLKVWLNNELWADPSSGSHSVSGMIIVPASMATIAAIASGYADSLITRAGDVIIKEGKNLIIVPRETPFSSIHLENMLKLSNIGVKIVPPIPGFYSEIKTLEDSINFITGKILDSCNIPNNLYRRWAYEQ